LAGDHPEQRRLAGPVGTDETDLFALEERRGGLDEQDLMAILLTDVFETNHARGPREQAAPPLTRCGASAEGRSKRRAARLDRSAPPVRFSAPTPRPEHPARLFLEQEDRKMHRY